MSQKITSHTETILSGSQSKLPSRHVRLCAAKRRIIKIRVQAFSKPGIIMPVKSVDINEMGSSYAITIVKEVLLRLSIRLT